MTLDDPPPAEKANYYDLGMQQELGSLTLGIDSYYKQSTQLIDEEQFGAPIILTPFNYRYGEQYGGELTANWHRGGLQAYANVAY